MGMFCQSVAVLYTYTETTTVLIDGNPYNVFVSHSGYGLTVEDITLQCSITVNGSAVNVTWFHNGGLHSRSAGSLNFFKNSNVSAIAGTYVCTASRSTWEVRVQFRILLKRELTGAALLSYLFTHCCHCLYCFYIIYIAALAVT